MQISGVLSDALWCKCQLPGLPKLFSTSCTQLDRHALPGFLLSTLWSGKCLLAGSLGTLRAYPVYSAFLGDSNPVSQTMFAVYFV